jgi:DNA repair protein RadC
MLDRRQKLQQILRPLVELNEFSQTQAKQICSEVSPAYVTKTIKQLVDEGVLRVRVSADEDFFGWSSTEYQANRWAESWIDQQIHGMQIKQTPEQDRPRERLLRDGPQTLSTADLLAILIRVGVRNESAVVGGIKIANRFANRLEKLPGSSAAELKNISAAATKSSYATIMAGIELGRRIASVSQDDPQAAIKITSTQAAVEYCTHEFARLAADAVQEEFHIVTLDTKHKPIRTHRITVGTLDASLVHPREVFRAAIRDAASAVLLVHNHPSGDPTPSREDLQVTDRLTEAGKLIGITVLDHIIVASEGCLSIREHS